MTVSTHLIDASKSAARKMILARTALVLDQPFFGSLALRLKIVEDPTQPTAWTDGASLGYNPGFINDLSAPEVVGLIAHEVMHCAAGHPWRRDGREPLRWNIAADRVINPILRDAKMRLPEGALFEMDPSHKGKSTEWVYDRIPAPPPGSVGSGRGDAGGGGTGGQGAPNKQGAVNQQKETSGWGDVRDAPCSAEDGSDTESAWQQAVAQAANMAKARGTLPTSLDRFADEVTEARVDWKSVLRRFVQEVARNDYSYRRPNRRYLASGLYLPELRGEEMGPIVIAVDTSGSIDTVLLSQFQAELREVIGETRPVRTVVMACDARVHRVDEFQPDEPIVLKPIGGGGTDFRPVFREVAKGDIEPSCLIYFTDLFGSFPKAAPEYPVLWATATRRGEVPFGETVLIG